MYLRRHACRFREEDDARETGFVSSRRESATPAGNALTSATLMDDEYCEMRLTAAAGTP